MNIVQVSKYFHPHVGGVEVAVRSLAEGLVQDHAVQILAARNGRQPSQIRQIQDLTVKLVKSYGEVQSVPIAPSFPTHLRRVSRSADLIHYHLPNPLATLSHLLLGDNDVATVATYHSDIVRQRWAGKLYRPFLDRFLEQLDHIFVTSRPLLEHSEVLAPYTGKCSVVPLSVPVEPKSHEDTLVSEDTAVDSIDGPVVLFVGRLVYYKGLEYLITAMKDVTATLVIAGDGPRRSRLQSLSENLAITDRVMFLGQVDEQTLGRCYEQADVFVLPSSEPSEAFGLVQLEAMAHGTPVVNTDLPTGVPWVSQDGETGSTVPPGDPEALAEAVTELLSNPTLRAQYGSNARRRAVERFSHQRRIADVNAVYQQLQGPKTARKAQTD